MDIINLKKNRPAIFIWLLLIFWFCLSIARTTLNISKIFSEEISWIGLSYPEKSARLFGEQYRFFSYIDANTAKDADILFFSYDGMPYYYGRYIVYPRRMNYVADYYSLYKSLDKKRYSLVILFGVGKDDIAKIGKLQQLRGMQYVRYSDTVSYYKNE